MYTFRHCHCQLRASEHTERSINGNITVPLVIIPRTDIEMQYFLTNMQYLFSKE